MEIKTKTNLLRAFAGECQARIRYEIAAKIAGKNDLAIIQDMLYFTASQEKEHAIIFYNYLKDVFKDEDVSMHGNYPIDLNQDLTSLLEDAAKHEYDEATTIYKQFGNEAVNVCPVCKHSNGYSLRLNETQFHV